MTFFFLLTSGKNQDFKNCVLESIFDDIINSSKQKFTQMMDFQRV